MSQRITAVVENGLLRPTTPLALPDGTIVELTIVPAATGDQLGRLCRGFGIWAGRGDLPDFARLRAEFDRACRAVGTNALFEDWVRAIEEYRRDRNAVPDPD